MVHAVGGVAEERAQLRRNRRQVLHQQPQLSGAETFWERGGWLTMRSMKAPPHSMRELALQACSPTSSEAGRLFVRSEPKWVSAAVILA